MEMLRISYQAGINVSMSITCSITKHLAQLLNNKKGLVCDKPIVGQFQKKLGQLEKNGAMPTKLNKMNALLHILTLKLLFPIILRMSHYTVLIKRLVVGCLLERKYEDSYEISKLNGKYIYKIGADYGSGDLISEILPNRHKGNCGQYYISIGGVVSEIHTYAINTLNCKNSPSW